MKDRFRFTKEEYYAVYNWKSGKLIFSKVIRDISLKLDIYLTD